MSVWEPISASRIVVALAQPTAMELWKAFSTQFPLHTHGFNSKELEAWLRSTYVVGRADPIEH